MVARKWWTLIAVSAGTFMLLLDITIVQVALPSIETELHASFTDLQWVVDAYALTLAALLLTAGSLADLFGRRVAFVAGLGLFSAASLLCGTATDPLFLILARALQGVGGATMFAVSLALLAQAFRGRERGTAFAVWGAVTGIAVAIGPVLGGAITSGLSWRWIFLVNVPIGAGAIAVTVHGVEESRDPGARRPDWTGFALFSAALGLGVYGLISSDSRGYSDAAVAGPLALAGVLLGTFVLWERRSPHAMFDLALFGKPTFSGGAIAAFGLSGSAFAVILYLVLYLQDILGFTALQTGLRLMVLSAGILTTSTLAGRLTSRVPIRALIGPGLALVAAGLLLMRGLDAASTWAHLVPGLLVTGVGIGLVNPPLASTAVGVVEPSRAGMASGINSTFRQVGVATGIALLGSLFGATVHREVTRGLAAVAPGQARGIAGAVRAGDAPAAIAHLPAGVRAGAVQVVRAAFTAGLDEILLVAAILAGASAVLSWGLIRNRDLVPTGEAARPVAAPG